MLKIGLTGGIGSGKSTVAGIFSVLGIPVFDADKEAKKLMHSHEIRTAIQQEFGYETYTNGLLNTQLLSKIVFASPFLLDKLNAIVHPVTIAAAAAWMAEQTSAYVIKEAALMFESGSAKNLDYVIGVYAPEALRIDRVMQRDNSPAEQIRNRMKRQIDETLKMRLCDFVVVNDECKSLMVQVLTLHQQFLKLA